MNDGAVSRRVVPARYVGVVLVIAAALGYGTIPTLARLAYAGGSDPMTVALSRYIFGSLVLLPLVGRTRVVSALRAAGRPMVLLLGVSLVVSSVAYMAAVLFVPVGVAVTVFYLYPIIVTVLARFVNGSPITLLRVIALVGAVSGVALTAINDIGGFDWRGVGSGVLAASALAAYIVFGARVARAVGSMTFSALVFPVAGVLLGSVMAVIGVSLPTGTTGWVGLIGATCAHLTATLLFFKGLTLVEPGRGSIIANVEPVWAIIFAWIVLGEMLVLIQLLGAVMVIGAVILAILPARGSTAAGEPATAREPAPATQPTDTD